ncbi:MAG TPA: phytanoyl-CoA dioxygenase family protein [Candidatus Methylomirabilis sp.]
MDNTSIARQFHEDGFIVVPGFVDSKRLREIAQQVDQYIAQVVPGLSPGDVYFEDAPSRAIKSLFRMHAHDPRFRELAEDPSLIGLMQAIFPQGEVICYDVGFFGKAARDGSVTPPHQDNGFTHWNPPLVLKASLAIDDATAQNGVMICQKGSHHLGVLPHQASGVAGFSQTLQSPVDTEAHPEVEIRMRPGDLALHHCDTVHRSGPNRTDRSRRMLSFVFRSSLAQPDPKHSRAVAEEVQRLHRAGARP